MPFGIGSLGWMYYEMEYGYIFTGAYDPYYWGYLPYPSSRTNFLKEKGDLLLRQMENPDLIEHGSFTELLWATVHLRDELMSRKNLKGLPETDLAHLANDARRAYSNLVGQWLDYLQYLKGRYPYLFSLALRTNPFVENPSTIVQ